MDEPIVGIDLGTTFSLVAYVDERGPEIVRDASGDGRVPSVICVMPEADGVPPRLTIGWDARNHAVENPRATIYSIKRLIGRSIEEIREELPFLAYAVQPGPRQTVQVEIGGRAYTPEQISSAILRELRDRAERFLGRPVRKAVITVPAYFDDSQRQATRDAGAAAGLDVVRIINEPTAAALAYGIGLKPRRAAAAAQQTSTASSVSLPQPRCHDELAESGAARRNRDNHAETVAVFDLGGGTFDISILRIDDGVFHVLATAGDTHLGGDDFDRRLIQLVQREASTQFGVSLDSPATRQAMRSLAEAVKIRLTNEQSATIELDIGQGRIFRREITRHELETLTADLVERSIELARRAIRDAKLTREEIDNVVLVGGSTRMPMVRRRVEEEFGRPPYTALNPDEVVAMGAAIQAALLGNVRAGGPRGGEADGGRSSDVEATTRPLDLLLLDVTPLSLGIETLGGAVGKLILRNTTIPCRATEMFTTFVDGQTAIKVNVLQGERELARDCRSLGEFELRGIPPMPAGIPKVEVEFLIDANGILSVAAREQRSGKQAAIQIVPNRGLTREEVERIKRESEQFGKEDFAAHRRIDLLNQVEFDTQKAEQMLERLGGRVDAATRNAVSRDIEALRGLARKSDDLDEVYRALMEFGRSTLGIAELGIVEALRSANEPGAERAVQESEMSRMRAK